MLAKIAPRFVISGVIQNAYYANYMAVELTKEAIGNRGVNFKLEDPKQFFVQSTSSRNATSSATSPPKLDPLSLPVNMKLKNMMRQLKSLPSTMRSRLSSINSTILLLRSKKSIELSKPTTPVQISSHVLTAAMRYSNFYEGIQR